MSNLPPGVTESMIPGNRPEDIAYEELWERVYDKAYEVGLVTDASNDLLESEPFIQLIDWLSGHAYQKGYTAGAADAQMNLLADQIERQSIAPTIEICGRDDCRWQQICAHSPHGPDDFSRPVYCVLGFPWVRSTIEGGDLNEGK